MLLIAFFAKYEELIFNRNRLYLSNEETFN